MKTAFSLAGFMLFIIIKNSWQVPDQDANHNFMSLSENSLFNEPLELPNMKRHSEGTFSNDYSKYLETRRAQDFVQWLKNSKRNGNKSEPRPSVTETLRCLSCRSLFRRHADGTYTSDVSSYLQDQAAKEFVSWLKTGRGRRE
ncbi:glucagon b isoform X1 [Cynoglossus semilaevis]|uniref:glucagon b isoform X1 n=1 Tax=Cynoglossus semilaevis TaxID=244447 RepID=UPI000D62B3FF|nr:glucagon isoform X1 [Cynoglossus semilaevis]XP_024919538.1 glucagon isoform X1 [Cynoglossus semilaevis]